uniref:Conotoxin n=1 Tax=Conus praecellens TaxID=128530 RepID=A0A291C2S9_CONPC|nr:conotoxin [Conus praecellens]
MMWKMGAMFVLLLLFTLPFGQQEGDFQARKIRPENVFLDTVAKSTRGCSGSCYTSSPKCNGACNCDRSGCWCRPFSNGCYCYC